MATWGTIILGNLHIYIYIRIHIYIYIHIDMYYYISLWIQTPEVLPKSAGPQPTQNRKSSGGSTRSTVPNGPTASTVWPATRHAPRRRTSTSAASSWGPPPRGELELILGVGGVVLRWAMGVTNYIPNHRNSGFSH